MDFDEVMRVLGYVSKSDRVSNRYTSSSSTKIEPEIVIGLEGVKNILKQLLSNKHTEELTKKALDYAQKKQSSDTSSCCSQGACFKSVFVVLVQKLVNRMDLTRLQAAVMIKVLECIRFKMNRMRLNMMKDPP